MGVAHGKILGSIVEKTVLINKGQINGAKHGWLSGFESGQIHGIKRVFIEAYMNNINLYDKLKSKSKDSTVLQGINMSDLKRESMNEFTKAFRELKNTSS